MANSADDDASMHRVTTGTAKGYLVPGAAEEQANFICAVTVGLNDLETGHDVSFDHAAIRLGTDVPHTASLLEYFPNALMNELSTEDKDSHGSAHRNRHNGNSSPL